jgi:hypothetical protein
MSRLIIFTLFSFAPPSQSATSDQIRHLTSRSGILAAQCGQGTCQSMWGQGGGQDGVDAHPRMPAAMITLHPPLHDEGRKRRSYNIRKRDTKRYTNFGLKPPPAFF